MRPYLLFIFCLFAPIYGKTECPLNINKCDIFDWDHPVKIVTVKIVDIKDPTPNMIKIARHYGKPVEPYIVAEYDNHRFLLRGMGKKEFARADEACKIEVGGQYLVVLYGPLEMSWHYVKPLELALNRSHWTENDRRFFKPYIFMEWYKCLNMQGDMMYPITEVVRLTERMDSLTDRYYIHDYYDTHLAERMERRKNLGESVGPDSTELERVSWSSYKNDWDYERNIPPLDSIKIIQP